MERFLIFIAYLNDYAYKIIMLSFFFVLIYLYGINPIVFVVLLIGVLSLALLRFILTENYSIKGIMFEKKIKLLIDKKFGKGNNFTISDCLFKDDDDYAQVDNILVTDRAIYVIELKNYTGLIYGQEKDIHWTQVKGRYRNSFYNPVQQNNQHIKAIKRSINLFDNIPVFNIIVFSDNAILKSININSDNIHIVKDFDLYDEICYIEKRLNPVVGEKSHQYIKDMIIKNNIMDKDKREDYYRELARKHISNY